MVVKLGIEEARARRERQRRERQRKNRRKDDQAREGNKGVEKESDERESRLDDEAEVARRFVVRARVALAPPMRRLRVVALLNRLGNAFRVRPCRSRQLQAAAARRLRHRRVGCCADRTSWTRAAAARGAPRDAQRRRRRQMRRGRWRRRWRWRGRWRWRRRRSCQYTPRDPTCTRPVAAQSRIHSRHHARRGAAHAPFFRDKSARACVCARVGVGVGVLVHVLVPVLVHVGVLVGVLVGALGTQSGEFEPPEAPARLSALSLPSHGGGGGGLNAAYGPRCGGAADARSCGGSDDRDEGAAREALVAAAAAVAVADAASAWRGWAFSLPTEAVETDESDDGAGDDDDDNICDDGDGDGTGAAVCCGGTAVSVRADAAGAARMVLCVGCAFPPSREETRGNAWIAAAATFVLAVACLASDGV
eukprot:6205098-Pleurochrysis_carterae.AAC.1